MAYTPNEWENVAGVGLNRWRDQNNNVLILTHDPLSIEELGTPFSAEWMNHIETGIKDIHDIFDPDMYDLTKGIIGDSTILRFDFVGPGEGIDLCSKAAIDPEIGLAPARISLRTAYPTSVDDESDMYSSLFLYDGNSVQRVTLQAWTGNNSGLSVRSDNGTVRAVLRYNAINGSGEMFLSSGTQRVVNLTENANGGEIAIGNNSQGQRFSIWLDEGGSTQMNIVEMTTTTSSANLVLVADGVGGYLMRRSTSLRKYKRNIENIGNTGAAVDALRAVRYKPLDADAEQIGLIAEEVEAAFPALASYGAHGELAGVNYDRVAVLLLADAQETHRRLKKIEEELGIC